MILKRRSEDPMPFGLSRFEMGQLAQYNAELARGLVHTPEWQARMALLQDRFNQASLAMMERDR